MADDNPANMLKDKDNDIEMVDPSALRKIEVKLVGSKRQVLNFKKLIKINNITVEKLSEENTKH